MASINEPEEPMSREQIATAAKRLVNELPTIAAGVAAVLYIFGINLTEAQLDAAVDNIEGLLGFLIWLQVRRNINGPVTNYRLAHEPPTD